MLRTKRIKNLNITDPGNNLNTDDPTSYFPDDRYSFAKNIEIMNPKLDHHNYYILSQDIPHDADGLLKNNIYIECAKSILTPNAGLDEGAKSTAPVGGKPSIANKKTCIWDDSKQMLEQIPNPINDFPDEPMNIRDTEQGSDYNRSEDMTPSWYFDPASRKFFPQGWERVKEVVGTEFIIDVSKYGVEKSTITFRAVTAGVIDVGNSSITHDNIEILCTEIQYGYIDIYGREQIDIYTDYIDSEGFAIYDKKDNAQYNPSVSILCYANKSASEIQSNLYGNETKKSWFTRHKQEFIALLSKTSRTKTETARLEKIHKRGMQLLISKRYGDLSHLLFSTNDNVIGTNDSYLADLAFLNGSSVMMKGTMFLLMHDASSKTIDTPDLVDIKGVVMCTGEKGQKDIYHCELAATHLVNDQTIGGAKKETGVVKAAKPKVKPKSKPKIIDPAVVLNNYGIKTNNMSPRAIELLLIAVNVLKKSGRTIEYIKTLSPKEIRQMAASEDLRKYFVSHNDELHNMIKTRFNNRMEEDMEEDMDIESNILEDIVYSSPDISHREFFCFTYNQGSYNIYWNLYTKLVEKKNYNSQAASQLAVRAFALRGSNKTLAPIRPISPTNTDIDDCVHGRRWASSRAEATECDDKLLRAINLAINDHIYKSNKTLTYAEAASDIAAAYGTNITAAVNHPDTIPVIYGYNGKLTHNYMLKVDDVVEAEFDTDTEAEEEEAEAEAVLGGGGKKMKGGTLYDKDNTTNSNPLNKMISFDNKKLTEFMNKGPGDSYTVKQFISFIYENCTSNTKKNIHNEKAKLKKYIENEKLLDEKTEDPLLTDLNVNIIINVAINANVVSVGEMEIFFLYIICKKSNNTIGSFLKTLDAFKIIMQDSFYFLNYNFLEEIHKLANEENSVIDESTLKLVIKNCVKNGSIKLEEEPGSSVVFDVEEEPVITETTVEEVTTPPTVIAPVTQPTVFTPTTPELSQENKERLQVVLKTTLAKLTETNLNLDEVTKLEDYAAIKVFEPDFTIGGVIMLIDYIEKNPLFMKEYDTELINSIKTLNAENLNKIQKKIEDNYYKEGTVFNQHTSKLVEATAGGKPKKVGTKKKRDKQSKRISHGKKNKAGTPKKRKNKKNGTRKNKKFKK